jgi:hypothetical protein
VVVGGRVFLQLADGDFEGFFGDGTCHCGENNKDDAQGCRRIVVDWLGAGRMS